MSTNDLFNCRYFCTGCKKSSQISYRGICVLCERRMCYRCDKDDTGEEWCCAFCKQALLNKKKHIL
jgi:hypothetical protein